MPSPYYVGTEQQFAHHETDAHGGAIPQQAGIWSVTNPAVARITAGGLATWLAAGETDIVFIIPSAYKAGAFHALVLSAVPSTLVATPSSVSVFDGGVEGISVAAFDALSNPVVGFEVASAVSSDPSVIQVIAVLGANLLVVGVAAGSATITVHGGALSLVISVTVTAVPSLSQADADARYRRLAVDISDTEITKTPVVDHGDVSGAVTRTWALNARAQRQRMVGNTVTTIADFPVGEFLFIDNEQDLVGGWTHHFTEGAGLPPIRWDGEIEPVQTADPGTRDSFMFYREATRVSASRTWQKILTT